MPRKSTPERVWGRLDSAPDFRRRLLRWFRRHARDLPWRRTRDPYHVLVSEFMLQQTQVARVEAYYLRFPEQYP
jgi:A/G-specific adenine glycosylase